MFMAENSALLASRSPNSVIFGESASMTEECTTAGFDSRDFVEGRGEPEQNSNGSSSMTPLCQ